MAQVRAQHRAVMAVVDLAGGELQLLAEEVEQGRQGRDRGGDDPALDPRDGRLRGARAGGELLLRHAVATARSSQELAGSHIVSISLMTYGVLYEPRWYARGACACAPPPSPRASAGRGRARTPRRFACSRPRSPSLPPPGRSSWRSAPCFRSGRSSGAGPRTASRSGTSSCSSSASRSGSRTERPAGTSRSLSRTRSPSSSRWARSSSSCATACPPGASRRHHSAVRQRPDRLGRLPEQYFTRLLARVAKAAAAEGDELVDLGRGNPDVPPPAHVVEVLREAAGGSQAHGYPPFLGLPELKEALAARYRAVYGVELDPEREVAVVPGTKTAIVELALCLAGRGDAILLPDPGYPDYTSGVALAGARELRVRLDPNAAFAPALDWAPRRGVAALYLNYPSNPCAASAPDGVFGEAVRYAEETGAAVVHDFAYADLVFDGLRPRSFLAEPGAREVGVELFSMSKSYGMAGWRLGFVVGNAEIVERLNLLQDHARAGVFRPVQDAAVAALTGPQETVEERRALSEARRDRVLAAIGPGARSDSTFYVWWKLPERLTPERLLAETRVAVAPGEGFGPRGTGWARISLATPDERLDARLARLRPLAAP